MTQVIAVFLLLGGFIHFVFSLLCQDEAPTHIGLSVIALTAGAWLLLMSSV